MKQRIGIDKLRVEHALESVCQLGCVSVKDIINEIEQGKRPEAVQILNQEECKCLLDELKYVMQAYE